MGTDLLVYNGVILWFPQVTHPQQIIIRESSLKCFASTHYLALLTVTYGQYYRIHNQITTTASEDVNHLFPILLSSM